ncbi:hypothetical protein AX769_13865 [Frondihabitans sp. PAMC 28766]|nr:hypothetical protein AX769_13865 [Frondihabitans sp. PAMC 28766]
MRQSILRFLGVSKPTRGRANKPPVYYFAVAVMSVIFAILCPIWGAPLWTTIVFIVLAVALLAVWTWLKIPKR